jgi:hypothetical protein
MSDLVGHTPGGIAVTIHDGDQRALGRQPGRHGSSDACARSGDERDASVQTAHQYDLGKPSTCSAV